MPGAALLLSPSRAHQRCSRSSSSPFPNNGDGWVGCTAHENKTLSTVATDIAHNVLLGSQETQQTQLQQQQQPPQPSLAPWPSPPFPLPLAPTKAFLSSSSSSSSLSARHCSTSIFPDARCAAKTVAATSRTGARRSAAQNKNGERERERERMIIVVVVVIAAVGVLRSLLNLVPVYGCTSFTSDGLLRLPTLLNLPR